MVQNFDDFEKNMNEGRFWDWLTGKNDETPGLPTTLDEYYKELEDFAKSGKAITVQSKGNMQYSDLVRKIQAGLDFLGFKMPRFGVDGYFGPETANAISNFNSQTTTPEQLSETRIDFNTFSKLTIESQNGRFNQAELQTVSVPNKGGTQYRLNAEAAADYERMVKAAEEDGVTWDINDAYRSYDQQVNVAQSKGLYSQGGLAAVPGTSNHGWGSAIDLKLNRKAQRWVNANAHNFGFTTIANEPWHWEHKASAERLKQSASTSNNPTPQLTLIDGNLVNRLIINLKNRGFSEEDLAKYQTETNKDQPIGGSVEDDVFYRAILKGIGARETPEKMKFLKAWRQAEGGQADYNPFNTTKNLKVSGIKNYNSDGVKEYPNPETGVAATVATLKLPYYKNLLAMLKDDSITAQQLASSPDLNTWGTEDGVAKVLAGGRINPPAIPTA